MNYSDIRFSDMLAAPLWDPVKCQFVGMLTVTDFIDILRYYKATGKDVAALATRSIAEILREAADESRKSGHHPFIIRAFVGADSACTLKQACEQLHGNSQDFLPIVYTEDMRVLACITYTNILEHLVLHFREQRRLFDDSISELGIGTYGNSLIVAHPNQSLSDSLAIMHQHNLSALPVVDPNTNKIIGVYSRSDITFLTKATDAEHAVKNLELPLSDILSQSRQDVTTPDALRTCSQSYTLQAIFETFAQVRFNRLYVVDQEDRLVGVVSARDLVAYFLSPSIGVE